MADPFTRSGQAADRIDAALHQFRYALTHMRDKDGLVLPEFVEIEGSVINSILECQRIIDELGKAA